MFPSAHSTVYYNEANEPIGWSDESQNDPYDPDDYLDYDENYEPDYEDDRS